MYRNKNYHIRDLEYRITGYKNEIEYHQMRIKSLEQDIEKTRLKILVQRAEKMKTDTDTTGRESYLDEET